MAKTWTEDEEEHIRQNFLTQTYGELAEHFEVTTKAMESKIRRMGLKKQELLAEAIDPENPTMGLDPEPPVVPEELRPTPIESFQTLPRRIEVKTETPEERKARIKATRQAAEEQKGRRDEVRSAPAMKKAISKFQAGAKKLLAGKLDAAAADFQAILDNPPGDVGIETRAKQYLRAAQQPADDNQPKLTSADDLYNHGVVQLNNGDLEGAIETLAQAAKKAPDDDRILYVQAAVFAQSGDFEAALEALAKAIGINDANRIYARNDSDFVPLRVHQEFVELITSSAPPEEEEEEEEEVVAAEVVEEA